MPYGLQCFVIISFRCQTGFAGLQAPDVMRSCCSALSLVTTALGGYLSAFLQSLVTRNTSWLDDLEHASGHLDRYFLLLAGGMLLNSALFVVAALRYDYKAIPHRAAPPPVGGQHAAQSARAVPQGNSSSSIPIGVRPGFGYQYGGTPSTADATDVYARSVTYMPQTPIMPAGFR